MAAEPTLIRNITLEVESAEGSGTYVEVKGVTQLSHSPSTQRADKSTFDNAGYNSQVIVGRGDSFSGSALVYEDEVNGARDPGQERCEALAQEVGQAAQGNFRITRSGGGTIDFRADAEVPLFSGGTNDLANWGPLTLTVQAKPTFTAPV